jgi:probable F420-dependent oxidoreductase
MEFGITFKGTIEPDRVVALVKQAELAGFTYAWFFDSHVLWQECYTMMAVCMRETKHMRFGPCVTNPGVRDWTVAASTYASLCRIGGERMDIGIGRGDSSRRVLGQKPLTVDTMVEFANALRVMGRGEKYMHEGQEVQLPWASYNLPIWVAAYGPKALAAAGSAGDGLIIQLADPWLVKWFSDQAKEAGYAAGRDMSKYQVMAAAPVWVGDVEKGREQTKWFPAMVGNHVADIVEKYGRDGGSGIPKRLTDYIEGRKGYNYLKHAEKDADHLDFISADVIDSFSLLGPAEAHVAKIKELEAAGTTQFNVYLMVGEEERQVAEYGEHVIPHFKK